MNEEGRLAIELPDGGSITALRTPAAGRARRLLVYAPGAGANVHDPFGRFLAGRLPGEGISTVRFQFPYMEARRRRPDRPEALEAAWRAVLAVARGEGLPVIAGGRSMGGRIASQVAAQGERVDGLALFAYPLHPPGQPERRRDAHLPRLEAPVLFCSGTRDAFASPEELRAAAARARRATVHLLDGADHSFAVPRASGRTRQDVWEEAAQALLSWVGES
jgi:hypothetical protein